MVRNGKSIASHGPRHVLIKAIPLSSPNLTFPRLYIASKWPHSRKVKVRVYRCWFTLELLKTWSVSSTGEFLPSFNLEKYDFNLC
jgi:hypothetical protein